MITTGAASLSACTAASPAEEASTAAAAVPAAAAAVVGPGVLAALWGRVVQPHSCPVGLFLLLLVLQLLVLLLQRLPLRA